MSERGGRVGRYELLGELAVGGMAEILLARVVGPGGFERPVVVKRILPHLAKQKAFFDMFLDEARIAASIRHHNVVHVEELLHEEGELFLVMEYLEGESVAGLTRRLFARDEPLDRALAGHIVAEACAGLHASHEMLDPSGTRQNLVHRDVSPQNIFVTYDGQVKILDYGVAKAADGITRTEAGQLKGKFEYMSPEQCRGEKLDRRSDIFALGIVLYELTTGRRLFKRASPLESLQAIGADSVVPPSRLAADYPAPLEEVCLRALSASRDDRYATCADMRRALLSALRASCPLPEPAEALGTLMRSIFSDRVAEKTEMLRRVRSGSSIHGVPAGEVDEAVEPPGIPVELTHVATQADIASAGAGVQRSGRRAGLGFRAGVGVLGVALAAATGALALRHRSSPPASPATTESDAGAAAASPALAEAAPPRAAASILLHVEARPSGATVSLDGEEQGTTPLDLSLPRSDTPRVLEVKRSGYEPVTQRIVADADQKVLVDLPPRAPLRKGAPAASTPSPAGSSPWTKWN